MSLSGTLDKEWIDQNYSYVSNRFDPLPCFEPTTAFYDDLARLGDPESLPTVVNGPLKKLFNHVSFPELPVMYAYGMKNAGEYQFSRHPSMPATVIPECIRISEKYKHITDTQARGMVIGTILAHEIAHYCLIAKGILREITDNERLTDLSLMMLGFGKLWFNGRDCVVEERQEQLGYLKPLDMTYAYMKFAQQNNIPGDVLKINLTPEAQRLYTFLLGRVNTELGTILREENQEKEEESRRLFLILQQDVDKTLGEVQVLPAQLDSAAFDQEIINRTIRFWEIPPEDHRIMAGFVTARASGAHEIDIGAVTSSLRSVKDDLRQMASMQELGKREKKDSETLRQVLNGHRRTLSTLKKEVTALQHLAKNVTSVHERCFLQVDTIQRELEETRATIHSCSATLVEIRTCNAFLSGNPEVWMPYAGNPDSRSGSIPYAGWAGLDETLALMERWVQEVTSQLSGPRHLFAERFSKLPPLQEMEAQTRSKRNEAATALQALHTVRTSQERRAGAYLKDAQSLLSRLLITLDACHAIQTDIQDLKVRQDRIYAQLDRLSLTPKDELELAEISRALNSCSADEESSSCTRYFSAIKNALQQDMNRVRSWSEGSFILPMEIHRKEFDRVFNDFQLLSGQVRYWTVVQQGYLDQLKKIEHSLAYRFRNHCDRILGDFKVLLDLKR